MFVAAWWVTHAFGLVLSCISTLRVASHHGRVPATHLHIQPDYNQTTPTGPFLRADTCTCLHYILFLGRGSGSRRRDDYLSEKHIWRVPVVVFGDIHGLKEDIMAIVWCCWCSDRFWICSSLKLCCHPLTLLLW